MSKVSIVIPTFNSERFSGEAVQSALRQDYSDIEVVVDDNRSVDETLSNIERLFGTDPRLSIRRNSVDLNIPHGWNRAVAASVGEFFLLLHSDNLLHPQCVSRMVALAETNSLSICYSEAEYFEDTENPTFLEFHAPPKANILMPGMDAVAYAFRRQRMIPTSVTLVRREALANRLPYDPKFSWDPDMELVTYLAYNFGLGHLPERLGGIRTHSGQARAWRDPEFSSQYHRLLEMQHRYGNTERHHFFDQWCNARWDITRKLSETQAPASAFFGYWLSAIQAESYVFLRSGLHFCRRLLRAAHLCVQWVLGGRQDGLPNHSESIPLTRKTEQPS